MKMPWFRWLSVLLLVLVAACARARPAAAPPAPPTEVAPAEVPEEPVYFSALAWSARPDLLVRTETGAARVPYLFTRFNVLGMDSLGVRIRCLYCIPALEGWVAEEDLVHRAASPAEAAHGELAEFVLAVREAAANRDLAALRPVMASDFTYSFGGGGGPDDALMRWQWDGFRTLSHLPALLDRGLTSPDGSIWSAPPQFVTDPDYLGLRSGFRRSGGRWQWIFLVSGD